MKIGKPAELLHTDALTRAAQAAGNARQSTGAGKIERAAEVDALEFSQTSRKLATETSGAGSMVRADKVEEVRQAIREGHFHVNATAVAEKMVAQAAELLETLARSK